MARKSVITADGTKLCSKCNTVFPVTGFYTTGKKKDGSFKIGSWCRSCVKAKMKTYHTRKWGENGLQYSAYKRTKSVSSFMSYLLAKAKIRKDCHLTIQNLVDLWILQKGKCALTNENLTMILGKGVVRTNASIDRINSSGGYTLDNVQLVCRSVNVAKHDLTPEAFISLCKSVVEKAEKNAI